MPRSLYVNEVNVPAVVQPAPVLDLKAAAQTAITLYSEYRQTGRNGVAKALAIGEAMLPVKAHLLLTKEWVKWAERQAIKTEDAADKFPSRVWVEKCIAIWEGRAVLDGTETSVDEAYRKVKGKPPTTTQTRRVDGITRSRVKAVAVVHNLDQQEFVKALRDLGVTILPDRRPEPPPSGEVAPAEPVAPAAPKAKKKGGDK